MTDQAPQAVADRLAVTDLIYRYCRAMDRRDAELGYSIWHEDGLADYGNFSYVGAAMDRSTGSASAIASSCSTLIRSRTLSSSSSATTPAGRPTSPRLSGGWTAEN